MFEKCFNIYYIYDYYDLFNVAEIIYDTVIMIFII